VAWVFAIVLDVEISQVHEIIEMCKNHDTRWERPGVQLGPAGQLIRNFVFISFCVLAEGNCIYRPVMRSLFVYFFQYLISYPLITFQL
jgi:hypothetical protein